MSDKLITLIALDIFLSEMDKDYEGVSEETVNLIESKIYESYGLEVDSSKERAKHVKESMLKDVYAYRDKLIKEIKEV